VQGTEAEPGAQGPAQLVQRARGQPGPAVESPTKPKRTIMRGSGGMEGAEASWHAVPINESAATALRRGMGTDRSLLLCSKASEAGAKLSNLDRLWYGCAA
jgi:hypothetical protein